MLVQAVREVGAKERVKLSPAFLGPRLLVCVINKSIAGHFLLYLVNNLLGSIE